MCQHDLWMVPKWAYYYKILTAPLLVSLGLVFCVSVKQLKVTRQRCNHLEIFGANSAMVGQNLPPWLE